MATVMTSNRRRRRSFAAGVSVVLAGISVLGVGASSDRPGPPCSSSLGETLHVRPAAAPPSHVGPLSGYSRSFHGALHVPFLLNVRGGGDEDNSGDDGGGGGGGEEEEEEDWRLDLPQSPYDYVSPSALDSYGGSPQIRHAHQAAVGRHGGTIVVAAVATGQRDRDDGGDRDNCINNNASVICCSLRRVRKGLRSTRLGSSADGDGGGRTIHVVSCADSVPGLVDDVKTYSAAGASATEIDVTYGSASTNSVVALAASGLKPDLNLLLTLMRTRSVEVWDRYDVPPGPTDVAESISQAFLSFLGYDRDKEAGDAIGPLKDENNSGDRREDGFRMSRPFGLEVIVLGVGWNVGQRAEAGGNDLNGSSILSVGPSGMVRGPFVAHAVGRGHELANNLVKKAWTIGMDEVSVRDICIDAIRRVAEEEMRLVAPNDDDGDGTLSLDEWEIVCETLSAAGGSRGGGIHSKRYPLAR